MAPRPSVISIAIESVDGAYAGKECRLVACPRQDIFCRRAYSNSGSCAACSTVSPANMSSKVHPGHVFGAPFFIPSRGKLTTPTCRPDWGASEIEGCSPPCKQAGRIRRRLQRCWASYAAFAYSSRDSREASFRVSTALTALEECVYICLYRLPASSEPYAGDFSEIMAVEVVRVTAGRSELWPWKGRGGLGVSERANQRHFRQFVTMLTDENLSGVAQHTASAQQRALYLCS